jgi:hypothetical protein
MGVGVCVYTLTGHINLRITGVSPMFLVII